MRKSWVSSLILVFLCWICIIQVASSAVLVVRATSSNSSKFVHHDLEEEPTNLVSPNCMSENATDEPQTSEKRRRALYSKETLSATELLDDHPDVSTTTETEVTIENREAFYSEEFLNCVHSEVEEGCYDKLPNGSVYVPLYKRLFPMTDYVINDGHLYVCPEFFDDFVSGETKFSLTLAIVSVVGTVISTVCILIHIGMFLAFQKLRNLPGYCLVSLCCALLVAYTCTFIPYFRKETSDCTAVGVIKAFAFLASFFWMNVMAYDIWRSLRLATAKLRLSSDKPMMTRFAMYSGYSWGMPLVIIILGFIVNSSESSHHNYRLVIAEDTCWFQYRQALLVYFAVPLFCLLILNVLLFASSFYMINGATMNTAENRADLWSRFLVTARLAVVMGLMWIFGVLATATEARWLWYFNVVCNVLQGVFIFFSFTLTNKTRKECRKAIARKKSNFEEESGIFRCNTRYVRQE